MPVTVVKFFYIFAAECHFRELAAMAIFFIVYFLCRGHDEETVHSVPIQNKIYYVEYSKYNRRCPRF